MIEFLLIKEILSENKDRDYAKIKCKRIVFSDGGKFVKDDAMATRKVPLAWARPGNVLGRTDHDNLSDEIMIQCQFHAELLWGLRSGNDGVH